MKRNADPATTRRRLEVVAGSSVPGRISPPAHRRAGVDRETFLSIMASFPSGVAIVTTRDSEGKPRGLTSSAICSVSAQPPLVLVCVDLTSRTLPALRHAEGFVVNFIRAGRSEVCDVFASKAEDKFAQVVWSETESGLPFLPDDALAWAECTTVQEIEAGDHMIFLGRVERGEVANPGVLPIVYYRRAWGVPAAPEARERKQAAGS